MEKLKAAGVGVECRGRLVSALLYADDAVLFAEDEEGMRVSLGVLSEWCKQWAVEINVDKCGVMHMRKKGVKRTGEKFHVDSKRIEVVRNISISARSIEVAIGGCARLAAYHSASPRSFIYGQTLATTQLSTTELIALPKGIHVATADYMRHTSMYVARLRYVP